MSYLVENTYNIFKEGKPLINILKKQLKREFKAIYNGGTTILSKIKQSDYKVLSKRVKLNIYDKIIVGLKSI